MGERQRRRRARTALAGALALLVVVPAAGPHDPLTKIAAARVRSAAPTAVVSSRAGHHVPMVEAVSVPSPAAVTAGERPILPPPTAFDAPAAQAAPPPATLRSAATGDGGGVWAVVIGIDDYPGSGSDLRASVADANDVDAALAGYGVSADRRLVLRNTQATASVVADAARWLVRHAGPDATAVFFYAGHVRKLGAGSEAIVAADGQLVTDVALADLLRPLQAQRTWIALASCYAGGFTEVLAPGRILTGAAGANSLAYESSELGNSYLVEYMIDRAMRESQAPGSVEQSYAWAYDALRREHPQRVPVQYDQLDGELRLGPPSPPPPAPQPTPPPPHAGGGSNPSPPPGAEPGDDPPDDHSPCVLTIGSIAGCDDRVTLG